MGTIPLGEDILLARHGERIVKFRQDRKKRSTIAYLNNGTVDSASNEVFASALQYAKTPAVALNEKARRYVNNESAVKREEVRALARISVGFSALVGTIFGGLLLAIYKMGGTEALASLANSGMLQ